MPPYPVITLTGADDPTNVTVDQQRFEGEDAYEQALQVCVARANELGGAVRVRGVTADGSEWPMVVTSDGQLHELPSTPTSANSKGISRRRLLAGVGIAAGALVVAGGATTGVLAWKAARETPPPPPPPKFPGKGANIPVLPPAGASTVATWAVVIDDAEEVRMLPSGLLAFRSSDQRLVVVNAATGQLQWAAGLPDQFGSLTTIVGETTTLLANYTPHGMDLWDLADPETPAPLHFDLTIQPSPVIATGEGALFDLGSQTAEIYVDGEMVQVDIPVPAVMAGARAGNAVGVNHTHWVEVTPDNIPTEHALQDIPDGARIDQARVLGTDLLAAIWSVEGGDQMTLHTLPEGALLGTVDLPNSPGEEEVLTAPNKGARVWRNTLITPDGLAPLEDYAPEGVDVTAQLLTDTEIWVRADNGPAQIPLASKTLVTEDSEATIPVATSDNLAFIVATRLDETILHAVEIHPPDVSPSDAGGSTASDAGGDS